MSGQFNQIAAPILGRGGGGGGGVWYGDEAMQRLANHVSPDLYTLMSHYLKK